MVRQLKLKGSAMYRKKQVYEIEEVLHKDHYTLQEVAYVLDVPESTVYSAIMHHELRATVIGDDVTSIARRDLIEWLRRDDHK